MYLHWRLEKHFTKVLIYLRYHSKVWDQNYLLIEEINTFIQPENVQLIKSESE